GPLTGLPTRDDLISITERGRLADGTPWPLPLTLEVPSQLLTTRDRHNPLRRALVVTNGEGEPMAAVDVIDSWPVRDGVSAVGGPVRALGERRRWPFASLRRTPAEVRAQLPPGRVVGVVADRPLHRDRKSTRLNSSHVKI